VGKASRPFNGQEGWETWAIPGIPVEEEEGSAMSWKLFRLVLVGLLALSLKSAVEAQMLTPGTC
jgi:hypothetical protein